LSELFENTNLLSFRSGIIACENIFEAEFDVLSSCGIFRSFTAFRVTVELP